MRLRNAGDHSFFSWRFEMKESIFKAYAKKRILERLSEHDIDYIEPVGPRSMPDMFILGPKYWAGLEFKVSEDAPHQPNQDYHVERLNNKGFAMFVYPENLEVVLDELENLFSS